VRAEVTPTEVTIAIPWELLGMPDTLFVQGQDVRNGSPVAQTSWCVVTRAVDLGGGA